MRILDFSTPSNIVSVRRDDPTGVNNEGTPGSFKNEQNDQSPNPDVSLLNKEIIVLKKEAEKHPAGAQLPISSMNTPNLMSHNYSSLTSLQNSAG